MSLYMLETKSLWQGNALAFKDFAAPTLTVTSCVAHTQCTHCIFLPSKEVVLQWHQGEQLDAHMISR